MSMLDPLPAHDACPKCGNDMLNPPSTFNIGEWLTCEACKEPVVTWASYKEQAMRRAVELLRRRSLLEPKKTRR